MRTVVDQMFETTVMLDAEGVINVVGLKPVPIKGDASIGRLIRGLRVIKNEAATEKAKLRIQEIHKRLLVNFSAKL